MSLAEAAARDAQIIRLQAQLLDYSGHVRPELAPTTVRGLVTQVNALRAANGWAPLDMSRRYPRPRQAAR